MKRAFALLTLLLSFSLVTVEVAHAKRLGGGGSFGRSYNTAPAPSKATPAPTASPTQKAAPSAAPAGQTAAKPKSGMMGGMLGGLLAGGLLAALFMGGAFDGIQLMDIVLIALFAWLLLRLFRRNTTPAARPAYAGHMPSAEPSPTPTARVATALAQTSVPMNLPLGFDSPAFLAESLTHYRTLQQAWNDNALSTLQEYFAPELFDALKVQREGLAQAPATEILALNAELVRAEQRFGMAEVSIRFTGHYRDVAAGEDESFTDIWHLERDYSNDNAPWHIVGITSN